MDQQRLEAVRHFLIEETEKDEKGRVYVYELSDAYYWWARLNRRPVMGHNNFSRCMLTLGYKKKWYGPPDNITCWVGIRMRDRGPRSWENEAGPYLMEFLNEHAKGGESLEELLLAYYRWAEKDRKPILTWKDAVAFIERK